MKEMSFFTFIGSSVFFALIIIVANYSVQYPILGSPLTYGALTYPISFLLMDILSEKYSKAQVLKTLWVGLFLAFFPSLFMSEPRIAIASVCAFIVSQNLDVHIFFYLKNRFPSLWWLRNNASTMISQFIDTMIFFHIAFLFIYPWEQVIMMLLADFCIKVFLALCDTPLFYILAIRKYKQPKITTK
ncbi:Putative preQ0 transporter [Helicobacter typhlonius]|uniref:Probable queuosine precursor transporter n=2 Tax=Helicobacter typhlonius TaxID=76936 RepID=A0A099UCA4_9HELI|nr:Putative preQ0 transporter [Helicobacter typhlonius]